MTVHILAALTGAVLTAVSQLALKLGASKHKAEHRAWKLMFAPQVLVGYSGLFLVTLLNLYAYTELPFRFNLVAVPISLVLVVLFSVWLIEERLNLSQIGGLVLIVLGLLLNASK